MDDQEAIEQARFYDEMINWNVRLEREIPVIANFLQQGRVLDVACASGRHSFALEELGFQTVGVDISEGMIGIARELAEEKGSTAHFHVIDAGSPALAKELSGTYFDGAILLGNAIANLGSREAGEQLLRNIFILLRPDGRFFSQTIHRPQKPSYNPLRSRNGNIVQRIMVPVHGEEYNISLHVNIINPETLEYERQSGDSKFYMYTLQEFKELLEHIGFEVEAVYSGYAQHEVEEIDGETLIWKITKPEIELKPEGIALFAKYAGMGPEIIKQRTLSIWQELMQEHWYHCIRGYRFLYPRITSHPRYESLISDSSAAKILDIGCNVGTDIRQMIVDGVNPENIDGVDISSTFWRLGYQLYDDKERLKTRFHQFDVLSEEFLKIENAKVSGGEFASFAHYFDLIHAGSVLHLLDEEGIDQLLIKVRHLLVRGGVFFGRTVGMSVPGNHMDGLRYLHSPESLAATFKNCGFEAVEVEIMDRRAPEGERSTPTHLTLAFIAKRP